MINRCMAWIVLAAWIGGLFTASAFGQQGVPDPAFLQRAIAAMQTQRNQAMDMAAVAEAKAAGLTDDLAKANARLKELEPKEPATSDKKE